jgi:hypothetical protein
MSCNSKDRTWALRIKDRQFRVATVNGVLPYPISDRFGPMRRAVGFVALEQAEFKPRMLELHNVLGELALVAD